MCVLSPQGDGQELDVPASPRGPQRCWWGPRSPGARPPQERLSGRRGSEGPGGSPGRDSLVSVRTVPGHTLQLVPTPQSVVTSAPCWSHRGLPPGPSLESTPAG